MINDLRDIADRIVQLSEEYSKEREISAQANHALKVILASKINQYQERRKNVGIDMAMLMLLAEGDKDVLEYSESADRSEARYKGLEQIILALRDKLYLEKQFLRETI